jgi:hypothetical protein
LGTTPLEIDVNLSENLTLNNTTTPGGLEFYGFGVAGLSPAIQPGGDAGQVMMELFEGATPVSPMFGFDFTSPFSSPISAYGTGSGAILPANAVFDEVKVFVSDSLSNPQETVTDVEISLQTSAVPDAGNTLPLIFLGCGATLGLGYRRGTVFLRQGLKVAAPEGFQNQSDLVASEASVRLLFIFRIASRPFLFTLRDVESDPELK